VTNNSVETVDLIEPWIWSTLSTDSALLGLVPIDSISGTLSATELTPPYVTFSMNSIFDVITGAGGDRIGVEALYLVKAVSADGSWDVIAPIARRLNVLLNKPYEVVTLPDGGSLSCLRDRIIQYPEVNEGVQYRHLGGLYRIRASPGA
jgi:hypothetical protein